MHPFSGVEPSKAMRTVTVASGSSGQYCPSWCQGTARPSPAGLQNSWLPHSTMSGPINCSTMSRISACRHRSRKVVLPIRLAAWPQGLCAPDSASGRTPGLLAISRSTSACIVASRSAGSR